MGRVVNELGHAARGVCRSREIVLRTVPESDSATGGIGDQSYAIAAIVSEGEYAPNGIGDLHQISTCVIPANDCVSILVRDARKLAGGGERICSLVFSREDECPVGVLHKRVKHAGLRHIACPV